MTHSIAFALLAASLLPLHAAAQDHETTEVADGVFQFRWETHNSMIVAAGSQVVVFDPISMEASRVMADEIRRVIPGARLAGVVYSHSDADHSAGAPALLEAFGQEAVPIIAHENAVAPIAERADPDHPLPTVTFAEHLTFLIEGRVFELYYLGPSHTDNIAIGFVKDAGVAFAVDYIAHDRVGYQGLPGWQFPEFFEAVRGMLAIPFTTVVFGHGPPGDRASIHRQIAYYDDLTAAVRAGIAAGLDEDETVAAIQLPDYAHFDQYENWMPLNARAIYRWLTGG